MWSKILGHKVITLSGFYSWFKKSDFIICKYVLMKNVKSVFQLKNPPRQCRGVHVPRKWGRRHVKRRDDANRWERRTFFRRLKFRRKRRCVKFLRCCKENWNLKNFLSSTAYIFYNQRTHLSKASKSCLLQAEIYNGARPPLFRWWHTFPYL